MNRLAKLALVTGATFATLPVLAAPASAAEIGPVVQPVYRVSDSGVFVGAYVVGQPGPGVWVGSSQTCVGFSYQVPQCVEYTAPSSTSWS